ncbi:MAG: DUF2306 domain-containing protein [Verrucomicrobia bacterium]|nr:DUF2306 domain-containing protein [Verrucomicrobiota bacterium]
MIRSGLGLVHTIAAVLALLLGAAALLRPKFGALHRRLGYGYVVSMVVVIVTALGIYRLTGRFNFLHGAALLSAATLGGGIYYALRRPAGWLEAHYLTMSWSYIGLVAALLAETATRLGMPWVIATFGRSSLGVFWGIVAFVTAAVCFAGARMIQANRARIRSWTAPTRS